MECIKSVLFQLINALCECKFDLNIFDFVFYLLVTQLLPGISIKFWTYTHVMYKPSVTFNQTVLCNSLGGIEAINCINACSGTYV